MFVLFLSAPKLLMTWQRNQPALRSNYLCLFKGSATFGTIFSMSPGLYNVLNCDLKVSVKENEVPTEKNPSRASIFATKASYISN